MIANDLRIGNWVHDGSNFPMQVVGIFEDVVYLNFEGNEGDVWECGLEGPKPFELTEEWLEKFGFEKNMKSTWIIQIFQENFLEIGFGSYPTFEFGNYFSERWNDPMKIDYVHQLQNLYFALSGREL